MNRFMGWISAVGILWALGGAAGCGAGGGVGSETTPPREEVCTLIGCDSGALYYGTVPLGGVDPATLEVRACMNTTCDTQPLRLVAGTGGVFTCAGAVFAGCQLQPNGTSAFITLQTLIPQGMDPLVYLKDGDTYQVTFGVPGQKPLVTIAATAGYQVYKPNGPNCGSTCKQVQLMPAP